MTKKNLLAVIGLLSVMTIPVAYGNPAKMLRLPKAIKHKSLAPRDMFPNCPNFSGTWVGQCRDSDGGEPTDEELVIEQEDCQSILIGGIDMAIGGMNSFGGKNYEGTTSNLEVQTFWNASRSELRMLGNGSLHTREPGFAGIVQFSETYSLAGDTLKTSMVPGKFILQSGAPLDMLSEECTYTRKPSN